MEVDPLYALGKELKVLEDAQRRDDDEHTEYRARRRTRIARRKELRAAIQAQMSERGLETFQVGDRVFARHIERKLPVTKALVSQFMGAAAFAEYTEDHLSVTERVCVKRAR